MVDRGKRGGKVAMVLKKRSLVRRQVDAFLDVDLASLVSCLGRGWVARDGNARIVGRLLRGDWITFFPRG